MNVLVTSAGRRAYIIKYFREALNGGGKVFACNSEPCAAFCCADDWAISPLICDSAYIPFLLEYCREKQVDVLVSLLDMDLPVLAENRAEFEKQGVRLIVSGADFLRICNDKMKTYEYLRENGFLTPETFLRAEEAASAVRSGSLEYPIVVKPRFGCGSIGVEYAYDEEELLFLEKRVRRMIRDSYLKYEQPEDPEQVVFQECVSGQEYGLDIINDLDGNYRSSVIHRKLAMRAGETDICEIADDARIARTAERLGRTTGHIANLDCDMVDHGGEIYILEMNARFGGGYPFSHMAGCDLPLAILKWCRNEEVPQDMLTAATGLTGFKEISAADGTGIF